MRIIYLLMMFIANVSCGTDEAVVETSQDWSPAQREVQYSSNTSIDFDGAQGTINLETSEGVCELIMESETIGGDLLEKACLFDLKDFSYTLGGYQIRSVIYDFEKDAFNFYIEN